MLFTKKTLAICILSGIAFLIGLVVGYVLWIYGVYQLIMDAMPLLFSGLATVVPNPVFLSDVASFSAMVIALLLPLNAAIVSKVSYDYDTPTLRYMRFEWQRKVLLPLLMMNVMLAIALQFFVGNYMDIYDTIYKVLAWLVLLTFFMVLLIIWKLIVVVLAILSGSNAALGIIFKRNRNP